MRFRVGRAFSFDEVRLSSAIVVYNLCEDPKFQRALQTLEKRYKGILSEDNLRWWLEEYVRCHAYESHFLSQKGVFMLG